MKLIDADALDNEMYRKSFETDDGRQRWHSGLWIRYKIYEEASKDAPTVEAVPVSFLEKLRDNAQNEEAALMIDEIIAQWRLNL